MINGSIPGRGKRFLSSAKGPDQLFSGYWDSLQWVKRPARDANHSTPPGTEAKNDWSCASTPTACLHGMDRDNFYKYIWWVNLNGVKLNERVVKCSWVKFK
jgi:hypothetical protein